MPAPLPDDDFFTTTLALTLAERFAELVKEVTESRSIAEGLVVQLDPTEPATAFVEAPQYWAVYYHDGRGPVFPRETGIRFLVWYKNPDDDPRNPSGSVRAIDVRRLTAEEFEADLAAGKLIVAEEAGPAPAHPFFTQAAALFEPSEIIEELLLEHLSIGLPNERVEARFRLPL